MRIEFETTAKLEKHLADGSDLRGAVFQGIDLRSLAQRLADVDLSGCVFLGCDIPESLYARLGSFCASIFPTIPDTPFAKYRGLLYTPEELLGDYRIGQLDSYQDTLDSRVYEHFMELGPNPDDAAEALTRRLHDMSITDAMQEFIAGKRVVAIMGGHSMLRSDPMYREVALIARTLTQLGYLVTTGGGPGAMEAAHVGAWFTTRSVSDLDDAIQILSQAPLYKPIGEWMDAAARVAEKYPVEDREACQSLGIPTWLYGHEPPALFALTIAKYFANSVREDGLLAIAKGGVVFTPGSAGTIQEIFQDSCQNHYKTVGVVSPMIFMGQEYWTRTKPVYPLLQHLAEGMEYANYLSLHDDGDKVIAEIQAYDENQNTSSGNAADAIA